MTAQAVAMVLSGKLKDKEIKVVDKLEMTEKKTQATAKLIANLKIEGKILFSFNQKEKEERIYSRNIKGVTNILTEQLNVASMLRNKYLVLSKESVEFLDKKYKVTK